MNSAWALVQVVAAGMAALFWSIWVWAALNQRWERRRGIEPTRVQVEARDWPAAIALFFTGLAVVSWLLR